MGADNLINFHKWQNWEKIFNKISIVIFKRHGYNNKALKSIALKKFIQFQIKNNFISKLHFDRVPSWSLVNNREINISSSEIRKQREHLRGLY
tara:strand:- start:239 stop:517 length:279 start_codon:yes stop_codon:yes gene_type:complete